MPGILSSGEMNCLMPYGLITFLGGISPGFFFCFMILSAPNLNDNFRAFGFPKMHLKAGVNAPFRS